MTPVIVGGAMIHHHEPRKSYYKSSPGKWWDIPVFGLIFLFVMAQIMAFVFGAIDIPDKKSCSWPDTVGDLLIPVWPVGCGFGKLVREPLGSHGRYAP